MPTDNVEKKVNNGKWHPSAVAEAAIVAMTDGRVQAFEGTADSMVSQILSAKSWSEVNLGGSIPALSEVAAEEVVVTALHPRKSEIKGGMSVYLVVDGYEPLTNIAFTAATSATTVVLQLLQLETIGALPVKCHVEESRKATENGYYPQRLVVTGKA